MKLLLILLISIISCFSAHADSSASVCVTGIIGNAIYSGDDTFEEMDYHFYEAAMSCQDIKHISDGVQAVAIAFGAGGIYAACSGMVPVTIALEGGALALSALSLVISNFDCQDTDTEALIKERVDEVVCSSLEAQGLSCYPPLDQIYTDILTI